MVSPGNPNQRQAASSSTVAGSLILAKRSPLVFSTIVERLNSGSPLPSWDFKLHLIFNFLRSIIAEPYNFTVEELQKMTRTSIPSPPWVRVVKDTVPQECRDDSAILIEQYLGPHRLGQVGRKWKEEEDKSTPLRPLVGEWVAMQRDWKKIQKHSLGKPLRKNSSTSIPKNFQTNSSPDDPTESFKKQKSRTMVIKEIEEDTESRPVVLFIHGGAYYLCGLDTHRMIMWKIASKIGGRVFAPDYRLAPQNQFPAALHDALAAYLYLIRPPINARHKPIDPNKIVLVGDSSGGGLILSLLLILRENYPDLPSPAGAVTLSPWVDLTHSFPSCFDSKNIVDYVPETGFRHRPSPAWPIPPNDPAAQNPILPFEKLMQAPFGSDARLQFYAPNNQLQWDLVSPLTAELGNLPPILIISGSVERLRDEHIYLAHKMAMPENYRFIIPGQISPNKKYDTPTSVHFQIYDDMPHVFTMFGVEKVASMSLDTISNFIKKVTSENHKRDTFFIRERVNCDGKTRPMENEYDMPALGYPTPCQFQFETLRRRLRDLQLLKYKKLGAIKYDRYHLYGYDESKAMKKNGAFKSSTLLDAGDSLSSPARKVLQMDSGSIETSQGTSSIGMEPISDTTDTIPEVIDTIRDAVDTIPDSLDTFRDAIETISDESSINLSNTSTSESPSISPSSKDFSKRLTKIFALKSFLDLYRSHNKRNIKDNNYKSQDSQKTKTEESVMKSEIRKWTIAK